MNPPTDDKDLSGFPLEIRVQRLFESVEFDIKPGRVGKEDFVIVARDNDKPKLNLVIEVKSASKRPIGLQDLRQLDDWVFDLSGESEIRKNVYTKNEPNRSYMWKGAIQPAPKHPTPHKGVMVFNGLVGTPFGDRSNPILHPNQVEFAKARNLCIMGLEDLITLSEKGRDCLWKILHSTEGEYSR